MDSNIMMYNYHIEYHNDDTNKLIGFKNWILDLINPIDTNKLHQVNKYSILAPDTANYINFVCGLEGKYYYIDEEKTPGQKLLKNHLHINVSTTYPPKKLRNKITRNKQYYAKKCYYLETVNTTELQNIGYVCKMNTNYKYSHSHLATYTLDQIEASALIALSKYKLKQQYSTVDRKQKILIELQDPKPTSISKVLERVMEIYERENYLIGNINSIENLVIHLSLKLGLVTLTDFKDSIMNAIKLKLFKIKI